MEIPSRERDVKQEGLEIWCRVLSLQQVTQKITSMISIC